jgi:hypothetical protein
MTQKKKTDSAAAVADLEKRKAKAEALLQELLGLFPEAAALPADDRLTSQGRMGDGESAALVVLCDVVDAAPAAFAVLADEDAGDDPTKVETDLVRTRFAEHDLYRGLAGDVARAAKLFSDTALARGILVKPFAQAAYEIAKPLSKRDPKIRSLLAPALDYYANNAKLAAASRKAKHAPGNGGGTPPATGG